MSEKKLTDLSGVAETLLIPLYNRAMESQRPDAMMKDEKAVALVAQMELDFARVRQVPMSEVNKVMRIMLTREMDRYTRDFICRHPDDAVIVHIGCGLDSRYERVAQGNSQVEWYDLDLPDVIDLRRRLTGEKHGHYHLLACSVLEDAWLEVVKVHTQRPFLFLAETVFVYFSEAQVRALLLRLRDHFPGAELVFDGFSPFDVWVGNRQLAMSKTYTGLLRWGLRRGQEIEDWGESIRLLDQWSYFDQPEPRLDAIWWIRAAKPLLGGLRIYHFRLGEV
jgi:O-methyltransferase involved in polyketide biosynthesis